MKKIASILWALALSTVCHAQKTNKSIETTKNKNQSAMENKDFTSTILVNKSANETFEAIKNFRGWWSEDIDGATDQLGETFLYHYQDVHLCKIKFTEAIPSKRLVYLVIDNKFSFTKDKTEWIGTQLIFDLSEESGQTKVNFTHKGLVPEYECYNVCNDAWTGFIQKSLKDYINTGKGQPNPKDGTNEINAENIKKWNIEGSGNDRSYTFGFDTKLSAIAVFDILHDPNKWWTGIYGETIKGSFDKVGDVFTYSAGDGLHYSEQKVTELVPGKKLAWKITKSNLSFLQQKDEWTGTTIALTISETGGHTHVQFTHEGLLPEIECYGACSNAWSQYMNNLKQALNGSSGGE